MQSWTNFEDDIPNMPSSESIIRSSYVLTGRINNCCWPSLPTGFVMPRYENVHTDIHIKLIDCIYTAIKLHQLPANAAPRSPRLSAALSISLHVYVSDVDAMWWHVWDCLFVA